MVTSGEDLSRYSGRVLRWSALSSLTNTGLWSRKPEGGLGCEYAGLHRPERNEIMVFKIVDVLL